jgi:hypothetical protein
MPEPLAEVKLGGMVLAYTKLHETLPAGIADDARTASLGSAG